MKVSKRARKAQPGAVALAVLAAFVCTPAAAESTLGARPAYKAAPHTGSARAAAKVRPPLESQAVEAPDMSATDVQGERDNDRARRQIRQLDARDFSGIGYRFGP